MEAGGLVLQEHALEKAPLGAGGPQDTGKAGRADRKDEDDSLKQFPCSCCDSCC